MNTLFISIIIFALLVLLFIFVYLLVQKTFQQLSKQGDLFQQSHEGVGKRLLDLQGRLAKMEEANLKIFEVGKDIASLQEILRAPKLRGNLGELFLGDILRQVFPLEHFELQYAFKSGEKVDAIVKLDKNFVSIDSKFPLENFKKYIEATADLDKKQFRKIFLSDIKKHVDAIALKYIKPEEGSFDFALMYIPAENVYYEMIIKEEVFESDFSVTNYAMSKKVIPVSPNNFYIYLQTILMGLKGLQVESSAKKILATLNALQGDLQRFKEDYSKMGTHLSNARAAYESADKRLDKLNEKLEAITLPTA